MYAQNYSQMMQFYNPNYQANSSTGHSSAYSQVPYQVPYQGNYQSHYQGNMMKPSSNLINGHINPSFQSNPSNFLNGLNNQVTSQSGWNNQMNERNVAQRDGSNKLFYQQNINN